MLLQDLQATQAHIDELRRDFAHTRAARSARHKGGARAGGAAPAATTRAFWRARRLMGARP